MSGFAFQEAVALVIVATAAAWLVRNWLMQRRSKSKGCAGCALAKAHGANGAATPGSVSSAAAADPRR